MAQIGSIGIPSATLHLRITYPTFYHWRLRLAVWVIGFASFVAPKQVRIVVETEMAAE